MHEQARETRFGDALFITLVSLAVVYIVHQGGIETERIRPDKQHDKPHKRQTTAALCGALFVYSGLRGLRAAFVAAQVASDYTIQYNTVSGTARSAGYAYSSTDTTVPLSFAHGTTVCIGLVILLHDDARVVGSSAVAYEVGAAGLAVLVAATWALLGKSRGIEVLNLLYSTGACRGDENTCFHAARARRLVMVNNNSASAWLSGLAALAFSFAIERRFLDTKTRAESMWQRQGVGVSLAMLVAMIVAALTYSRFDGAQYHTDIVLLASIAAIFVSATTDTLLGTALYAAAMSYEQMELLQNYGSQRVFVHLTHVSLFCLLLVMWAWVAAAALKDLLSIWFKLRDKSVINQVMGAASAAGTSLSFGLFVASALLLAASNGSLPQEDDVFRGGSPRRSLIAFLIDHFLPFLAWAPTYVCRCEVLLISAWSRAVAWLFALPMAAAVYFAVLWSLDQSPPAAAVMQVAPMSAVGFAGLAAWLSASVVY